MVSTVAMLFVVTGATSVEAASVAQPEKLISFTTAPMQIVGFDRKVAAAHGFEIRPDANGTLTSVAVTDSAKSTVTPDSIVTANCGSSWVYIYDTGVRQYRVDTGFGVVSSAVAYSWYVNIVGPGYNKTPHWWGTLAFSTVWSTSYYDSVTYGGVYSAKAWGTATLWNGSVCSSLGPIDNQAVY